MPSLRMPSMALNRFSSDPTTAKLSSTNQINVKAFYIARGIDILKVHASAFGSLPTSRFFNLSLLDGLVGLSSIIYTNIIRI